LYSLRTIFHQNVEISKYQSSVRKAISHIGLILNYNSERDLIQLLKLIQRFENPFPIVIVDNASNDNSRNGLYNLVAIFNFVEIVFAIENRGYAFGNNIGFNYIDQMYKVDYVVVMNPDITFEEAMINQLLLSISNQEKCAIIGGTMKNENGIELISCWKLPRLIDSLIISITIIHKILGTPIVYKKDLKSLSKVDVIQGAMFIARFDILKEVGYFSNRTFLYMEESILGIKIKEKGFYSLYLPDFSFCHKVGASINQVKPLVKDKYKLLQDSRRIYHKYYLKNNKIELLVFEIFTFIGLIEKSLIDLFIRIKRVTK